jgi:hypothetical protein
MDRVVALKFIQNERLHSPEAVLRFRREIRVLAQLDHPNIVRAFDADEVDGTHFLVMEYVEGTNLAEVARQRGPLPVAQACAYIRQAAAGLHHAHGQGVIHRDIKPGNLVLTATGNVKLLDLGLANIGQASPADEPLTLSEGMLGTAEYLAPEQRRNAHAAGIRADLYSLGCTFYHLLVGRPPLRLLQDDCSPADSARSQDPIRVLREVRPDLPQDLAAIVSRLLAENPSARFASAAEVHEALGQFAGPSDGEQEASSLRPISVASARRRRWHAVLALGVLVVLLMLMAMLGRPPATGHLRVASFRVHLYHGNPAVYGGDLGLNAFAAPFNDAVLVAARFSEPAYCFLIAFNPDGNEQYCYPKDKSNKPVVPVPTLDFLYPPPVPGSINCFRLNDGTGLQAFVLVASNRPLPAYDRWRAATGRAPWKRVQALGVWHYNGRELGQLEPAFQVRGQEELREVGAPAALDELYRFFKRIPDVDAVEILAFPVRAAAPPGPANQMGK